MLRTATQHRQSRAQYAVRLRVAAVATFAAAAVILSTALANSLPARTVVGNTIVSEESPTVRVSVPKNAVYVGTDHWTLYGIADCQLFVFAEVDSARRVQRLYWVQFEHYVASMPKLSHQYTSLRRANLGSKAFIVDDWIDTTAQASPPDYADMQKLLAALGYPAPANFRSGSDSQHMHALLAARGFSLSAARASVRLVHLLDAQKRGELMIIYSEAVSVDRKLDEHRRGSLLSAATARVRVTFR
jgi:hypothetical protein